MIQAIALIEKYFLPQTKAYGILRTHSEQVANKATSIAMRLNQGSHKPLIDIDFITEAALLHDIGIFAVHAPGLGCFGQLPYLRHGLIGAQLLNRLGMDKHALVCERHIGVGLTADEIATKKLPLPQRNYLPLTIEEQIITYADLFFSKNPSTLTQEKSAAKVRQSVSYYGEEKALIFDQWHSRFSQ